MTTETSLPESLRQLALDIFKGLVFTSRDIWDSTPLEQVFMGLLFLNDASRKQLQEDPPGLLFAYYADAGPRGINGNPIFMEFGVLTRANTERVYAIVEQLGAATAQVLSE